MTSWLDFRREPLSNIPEVQILAPTFGNKGYLVECLDLECGFNQIAIESIEAEDLKAEHERWHEDGMPE